MKVGVIGYKNHSQKIISILQKQRVNLLVYCHKKNIFKNLENKNKNKKTNYTDNIIELKTCDAIFITSPNQTHIDYIKYFIKEKIYIFCEKPPCINLEDFEFLYKLNKKYKNKIYFNFNYLKSNTFRKIKKEVSNKDNGSLLNISIYATHGLFFKKNLKNNWRLNDKNIFNNIYGNLGIHYLNFLIHLFKKIKINNLYFKSVAGKKISDTVNIDLECGKNVNCNIFLSYASIMSKKIFFYFNNALIELTNNKLVKYFPRDTFDRNGNFKIPKKIILNKVDDLSNNSIAKSVNYFLKTVKNNESFNTKDFNISLETVMIVLKSIKKN